MFTRKLLGSVAAVLLFAAAIPGCGSSFAMAADPSVPFAQGTVDASFKKDGNGQMTVKVQHLGDASKLNPSATTYIVWIRPRTDKGETKPQNMGTLKVDSSESGSLEFNTTFKSFDITITPEASTDVTTPTGRDILKATVSAN